MIEKYVILLLAIIIFLLLILELNKNKSKNNISSEYLYENYESYKKINNKKNNKIIYYPKVVTWSPSYVDNYYQPGYNQYFYNNGYYYPVF
jgi:hypothetical protein